MNAWLLTNSSRSSYSCIGYVFIYYIFRSCSLVFSSMSRGGTIDIVANDRGNRIIPSRCQIQCQNAFHSNPANTVFDAKRLIGRRMDSEDIKRVKDMKHLLFKVTNKSGKPYITIEESPRLLSTDLGGGTFDVSLSIDDGVFEVLATAGDTYLGGEDFDNCAMDHLIKKKTGIDVSKNQHSGNLSSIKIKIESFEDSNDFLETLTCAQFEELNVNLFHQTLKPVEQVLKDTNVRTEDVDGVVLVRRWFDSYSQGLKDYFGKESSKGINPDEAVAYSAAVQGAILASDEGTHDMVLVDVNLLTLSIETTGRVFTKLIPHNIIFATRKSQMSSKVNVRSRRTTTTSGKFELTSIPPAPCCVPQIEVTFEIDANGILKQPKRSLGKLSKDDKKTILNTIETMDWIEEHGSDASTEDPEEKLADHPSATSMKCRENED
ncbi:hypothetical protein AX14_008696 [Amanita brunnescens Koide BX004]|nr:hypothetical protein AX14_008696 [Amanita brunnescens Koide BX004]